QNLDYGGQLRGGSGQAQLQATWSGGPSAFRLGNLQGRLDLHARNGPLLELEPGTRRVLGLLSSPPLPRRLKVEFRDCFSKGRLDLHARNGQLLELEPGAGRVLGLLSVTQLPRRLMFDFRDFFSKGFAFNQIDGSMQFGQGMARTDKVLIEGPAANITIRGQA